MARPVAHIVGRAAPVEVRIRQLRIPKARQKQLCAMMDEAWARLAAERRVLQGAPLAQGEKFSHASAAN